MLQKNVLKRKKAWLISGIILVTLPSLLVISFLMPQSTISVNQCRSTIDFQTRVAIDDLEKAYGIIVVVENTSSDLPKWVAGLKETILLFPQPVLEKIVWQNNSLTVRFVKHNETYVAFYTRSDNTIGINLTPLSNHPSRMEPISKNGYDPQEIIYVFLHELGHSWETQAGFKLRDSYFEAIWSEASKSEENSPSLYSKWIDASENNSNYYKVMADVYFFHRAEDFAEGFAFYVLLPEYMKENFLLRYNWFKENVFNGTEYEDNISPIPSSIKSRLTKPLD